MSVFGLCVLVHGAVSWNKRTALVQSVCSACNVCAVWASDSQREPLLSSESYRTELFGLSCVECLGLCVGEASRILAGLGAKAILVSYVQVTASSP